MVVFDVVAAGLVAAAAALGAWKGFAWQVAAVLSPIVGVALGWPLAPKLAPHLGLASPLDRWAAFGILYVAISLLLHLLALGLRKTMDRAGLRPWDRHLGFVAGGLKGFALAVVLTAAALGLFAEERGRVKATRMGQLITAVVRAVDPALPPAVRDAVAPVFEPFLAPDPPREAKLHFSQTPPTSDNV